MRLTEFIEQAHDEIIEEWVAFAATLLPWAKGMDEKDAATVAIANHAALLSAVTPKIDAFAPGSDIVAGIVEAVDIKGHTPGHSGYLIGSGADSLLCVPPVRMSRAAGRPSCVGRAHPASKRSTSGSSGQDPSFW